MYEYYIYVVHQNVNGMIYKMMDIQNSEINGVTYIVVENVVYVALR